jgi:hypothetical protein
MIMFISFHRVLKIEIILTVPLNNSFMKIFSSSFCMNLIKVIHAYDLFSSGFFLFLSEVPIRMFSLFHGILQSYFKIKICRSLFIKHLSAIRSINQHSRSLFNNSPTYDQWILVSHYIAFLLAYLNFNTSYVFDYTHFSIMKVGIFSIFAWYSLSSYLISMIF